MYSKLLLCIFAVILFSCSSEEVEDGKRIYNIEVVDIVTKEKVPNVELKLLQHFGGSDLLHIAYAVSNQEGLATLISEIDEDSLTKRLEDLMIDPSVEPNVVWQALHVTSSDYVLQNIEQNNEELPHIRTKIEEETLASVFVWKAGTLFLNFVDVENTHLYDSVTVEIRATDGFSTFLYRIGNPGSQSPEWELKIPAGFDVKLIWEIYEGPSSYGSMELVKTESHTLNVGWQESTSFVIEH
ncbi:MAG: hypothetical protein HKN51_05060 [Saprospiraceae bacterium]|nr:hypothetical protein [Saprospiraceae bacterium]